MSVPSYTGSKCGRNSLVDVILPQLGTGDVICEPLCGSGGISIAALEAGLFERAVLNDANPHIMCLLMGLKLDPAKVLLWASKIAASITTREELRDVQLHLAETTKTGWQDPTIAPTLAGMVVGALRKTHSSLWRRNLSGVMNAGLDVRGTRRIVTEEAAYRYHVLLQRCELSCNVWKYAVAYTEHDSLYVDPPYWSGGFKGYGTKWGDAEAGSLAGYLSRNKSRVVLSEVRRGAPLYLGGIEGSQLIDARKLENNLGGHQIGEPRDEVLIIRQSRR